MKIEVNKTYLMQLLFVFIGWLIAGVVSLFIMFKGSKWLLIVLLLICSNAQANDFVPDTPDKVERLVMAIYKAEGGKQTKYPFGIKSVECKGYEECKRICRNTVVNNVERWEKSVWNGDSRDYITYLWHRYCPPAAHKLNGNWKKNVLYFLNN